MSSVAALEKVPLLEELSAEEREVLDDHLESESMAKGRVLFEEGDEGSGLALLLAGEVELESRDQGSLGKVGAGAALGGLSLIAAGRRETTALTTSSCEVAWLDRSSFRRLVDDAPRLACKLMEALLREAAGQLREGLPVLRQALPSRPNDGPH